MSHVSLSLFDSNIFDLSYYFYFADYQECVKGKCSCDENDIECSSKNESKDVSFDQFLNIFKTKSSSETMESVKIKNFAHAVVEDINDFAKEI